MKPLEILDVIASIFPDAACELNHRNNYEMTVAVILSAQTTDASVNKVTPVLFGKYPDIHSLAHADIHDVESILSPLGLYRSKAMNIIGMAKVCEDSFDGEIPDRMKDLLQLPGVGRKCGNVILAECYGVPSLAVDTHVNRISKRLGLAKEDDSVDEVEVKLKRKFPRERWIKSHHQMIFFGRYLCHARNPECARCPLTSVCRYYRKQK